MRKKMGNHFFIIFYPGLHPLSTASQRERDNFMSLAIARDGEFVSLCTRYAGEPSCAVFHSPQELRDLREVLDEAADAFEAAQAQVKGG